MPPLLLHLFQDLDKIEIFLLIRLRLLDFKVGLALLAFFARLRSVVRVQEGEREQLFHLLFTEAPQVEQIVGHVPTIHHHRIFSTLEVSSSLKLLLIAAVIPPCVALPRLAHDLIEE